MEQKGKVKFIRKNGRVIPIKDNGKGPKDNKSGGKKKMSQDQLVRKSSHTLGRAHDLQGKASMLKRRSGAAKKMFTIGGAIAGGMKKGLKGAVLGGIGGFLSGSLLSSGTSSKANKLRNRGNKLEDRALKMEGRVKNRDRLGDGDARRAYQRGLNGSSI